jgi:hypothetical protein
MITLWKAVFSALNAKAIPSEAVDILGNGKIEALRNSFRKLLLQNMKRLLQKPVKLTTGDGKRKFSLLSTLNALGSIGVEEKGLVDLLNLVKPAIVTLLELDSRLGRRLEVFMLEHDEETFNEVSTQMLHGNIGPFGDVTSIDGRQAVVRKIQAMSKRMNETRKLQLAVRLLENEQPEKLKLENLLATRHLIASCGGGFCS